MCPMPLQPGVGQTPGPDVTTKSAGAETHSDTGLIFTSCKLYYERPVSVLREYPILVFIFMN